MNVERPLGLAGIGAALLLLTAGCGGGSYVITTTSGAKIITATKPHLVDSNFVYKDANGHTNRVSKLRVRIVEPYSRKAAGKNLKVPELQ